MSIQHERILSLCERLNLTSIGTHYATLAQDAATKQHSFTDFLEDILDIELQEKQQRSRTLLIKMAGFPAIKTLEHFDFKFAAGIPKAKIKELTSLAFIERQENVIFLGPSLPISLMFLTY